MDNRHEISNGTLATMAMIFLSVVFVVLVAKESVLVQTVISVIGFGLAAIALNNTVEHRNNHQ